MIEVRIRHAEEVKSAKLGMVPFTDDDLDRTFDLVSKWSVCTEYGDFSRGQLSGQFVVERGVAFFEIVAGAE